MLRKGSFAQYAGLLALTVAVYLPVWNNDFVDFDDEPFITANPQVTEGLTWEGFRWAWTNYRGNYWQPLTWLSLQLDAHFFSSQAPTGETILSPEAFHGQNLLWHSASVLLLFALLIRLTGARWRSFLVAALFAVHPMHVESVAWAAERKDVLSVFFGILTLWAYVRYLARPGWKWHLAMTAAFLASLLAKPMLMTLPFVLLLLDYWPLRRLAAGTPASQAGETPAFTPVSPGRLVFEKMPLFLLALGIGIVTVAAREQAGATVSWELLPLSARLANAATAYGWYLYRTICPWELAVLYPHPFGNWSVLGALAGGAALLAVTVLALTQARRRPWIIAGWLWFVAALAPVIGLAQGGEQAWADRFSYWPHIGLFVALIWGLGELVERLQLPALAAGGAGAVVLGGLGLLTWCQVHYWNDTVTLWERALAVTEPNLRAHVNLGKYYLDRGKLDKAETHFAAASRISPKSPEYRYCLGVTALGLGRSAEAAEHFREALARHPKHVDARHNLGVALLRQGKPAEAARTFRKLLEMEPRSAEALAGMGLALWREGKGTEAIRTFQAALKIDPKVAQAWHGLGIAALARGRVEMAIEGLSKARDCNPQMVNAYSDLGLAFGRNGEWGKAVAYHLKAAQMQEEGDQHLERMHGKIPTTDSTPQYLIYRCRLAYALHRLGEPQAGKEQYQFALNRDPTWPWKLAAKARLLATDPNPGLRDPEMAYELASQAIQAIDDPSADMLDSLAAAMAALGRYSEAVQTAHQALAKTSPGSKEYQLIRDHLRLYLKGLPVVSQSPEVHRGN